MWFKSKGKLEPQSVKAGEHTRDKPKRDTGDMSAKDFAPDLREVPSKRDFLELESAGVSRGCSSHPMEKAKMTRWEGRVEE